MSQFPNCPVTPQDLQPPLRTEKFEALYQLIKIGTVCQDLSILLIYFIDTVDVSVLVHLAEQFDLLGCKGWKFTQSELERRELIKLAVKLHRLSATPEIFCILFSLFIQFEDLNVVIENPCLLYDGTWYFNGEWTYGGNRQDNFMIDDVFNLPAELRNDFRCLVKEYQRASSNFYEPFLPRFYDGSWTFDGDVLFDARSPNEITNYQPYRSCATQIFSCKPSLFPPPTGDFNCTDLDPVPWACFNPRDETKFSPDPNLNPEISNWINEYPNGNLTNDAAGKPRYGQTVNGIPVVDYQTNPDASFLANTNLLTGFSEVPGITLFFLANNVVQDGNQKFMIFISTGTSQSERRASIAFSVTSGLVFASGKRLDSDSTSTITSPEPINPLATNLIMGRFDYENGSLQLWINETLVGTNTLTVGLSDVTDPQRIMIGGGTTNSARNLDGFGGDAIILNYAIDDIQQKQMSAAILWEYGEQQLLPVDHPYRFNKP